MLCTTRGIGGQRSDPCGTDGLFTFKENSVPTISASAKSKWISVLPGTLDSGGMITVCCIVDRYNPSCRPGPTQHN